MSMAQKAYNPGLCLPKLTAYVAINLINSRTENLPDGDITTGRHTVLNRPQNATFIQLWRGELQCRLH